MWNVEIKLDALNPCGDRLTCFELTYPRFIHSELMTHRVFSRNAASSRAIPIEKMIDRILEDPAKPIHWGVNQRGMQANEELATTERMQALALWLTARDRAVESARDLASLGCHKQVVNRLLEPFAWMTTIVTATEWTNFFCQRCDKAAQPEFQFLAMAMAHEYFEKSNPQEYLGGEWFTPYILPSEYATLNAAKRRSVSVARCARVSYTNQNGVRDYDDDLALFQRLSDGMHWSPFEHVASACSDSRMHGNFRGWMQFRKLFTKENRTSFDWEAARKGTQWDPTNELKLSESPLT